MVPTGPLQDAESLQLQTLLTRMTTLGAKTRRHEVDLYTESLPFAAPCFDAPGAMTMHADQIRRLSFLALALLLLAVSAGTAVTPGTPDGADDVDRRWLDRLPNVDRAYLDRHLGHRPPALTDDLTWINGHSLAYAREQEDFWGALDGKVVLVQSFSSKGASGRKTPARIEKLLQRVEGRGGLHDVIVIMLHTPEGADRAAEMLERQPSPFPVMVDADGAFCDDLGIYKRPVNMLIDRSGAVRATGVKQTMLATAISALLNEEGAGKEPKPALNTQTDETVEPETEEDPAAPSADDVKFPTFNTQVRNGKDLRGLRGPDMWVDQWLSPRPNATNKVVVIDFWATWCNPCVRAIPHMNDLAEQFREDVLVVAISNETKGEFDQGMARLAQLQNLQRSDFLYSVALDPNETMYDVVGVTAIPHAIVLSSDWVVRWQGNPHNLTSRDLQKIVNANKKLIEREKNQKEPSSRPDSKDDAPQSFPPRWKK